MKNLVVFTLFFASLYGAYGQAHTDHLTPSSLPEEVQEAIKERDRLLELRQKAHHPVAQQKSSATIVLQLDSIYNEGLYVVTYEYNGDGSLVEEVQRTYNAGMQAYLNNMRTSNTYDENGYLATRLSQNWNAGDEVWINTGLIEQTHDADGNRLSQTLNNWSSLNNDWVIQETMEWTFENGLMTMVEQSNQLVGTLTPSSRTAYSYNEDDQLIESLRETYNAAQESWHNELRTTTTYEDGAMHTQLFESWQPDAMAWAPTTLREHTYEGDTAETIEGFWWHPEEEEWMEGLLVEIAYHSSGAYTQYLYQVKEEDFWRPVWQELIDYDEEDNVIFTAFYSWNQNTATLDLFNEVEREIDWDYTMEQLAVPAAYSSNPNFIHKIDALVISNYSGGSLANQITEVFFYSPFVFLSAQNADQGLFQLYPNPSEGMVYLKTQGTHGPLRMELYDLQGRKVMDRLVAGDAQISLAELPKGLYVYRVIEGTQAHTGKLIRQ